MVLQHLFNFSHFIISSLSPCSLITVLKNPALTEWEAFFFFRLSFLQKWILSPSFPFFSLSPILSFLNPEICLHISSCASFCHVTIYSVAEMQCWWACLLSFYGWDLFFLVAACWESVPVSHFAVIPDEEWVSLILEKWWRKGHVYVSCVWIFWAFSLHFSQVWTVIILLKEHVGITSSWRHACCFCSFQLSGTELVFRELSDVCFILWLSWHIGALFHRFLFTNELKISPQSTYLKYLRLLWWPVRASSVLTHKVILCIF